MSCRPNQSGIALVIVLWSVALLTLLVSTITAISRSYLQEVALSIVQIEARNEAEGAVQSAIAQLSLGYDRPYPHPLDLTISTTIGDESGKIDLNTMDRAQLTKILSPLVGAGEAAKVADRVTDWRDPDDSRLDFGAEAHEYLQSHLGFAPRNNQFRHVDEFYQVFGVSRALAARLLPLLTVYSRRSQIDLAVAPLALRHSLGDAAPPVPDLLSSSSRHAELGRAYTITSTATKAGSSATARAVVVLTGRPADPYRVVSWQWIALQ